MLKTLSGLMLTITFMTLLLGGPNMARGSGSEQSDPTWQAQYWNNRDLNGSPVVEREDGSIDFDWQSGSPDSRVNNDNFSARWTRYLDLTAGTYRFTVRSDDGVRVWVDNTLLINNWTDHAVQVNTADITLQSGYHLVKVEYYERIGLATIKVEWAAAPPTIYNWRGEYFNNMSLSGDPVLVRDDSSIYFNWGYGKPAAVVNADNFSVRWTRNVDFPAGTYRFRVFADDGVRLWVNNRLLINQWQVQAVQNYSGDIYLTGGSIPIKLEYYDNTRHAVITLSWERVSEPTAAWQGEYFNNDTLSGTPAMVRSDRDINFNWGRSAPAAGIDGDTFSVRWKKSPEFAAGRYRFTVTADDGVRLWVNRRLLIDEWNEQAARTFSGDIYLPGGAIPVQMEYCELYGLAEARLNITPLDTADPAANLVDNTDAGFVSGGSASGWHVRSEGYGGSLVWTQNNNRVRSNYNWARWYPSLTAGRYEVFVYIPQRFTTTSQARYWVSHQGGYTLQIVDQSTNGDRWVSLGTYWFQGTRGDYVSLSDVTFEPRLSRLIAFDAVKWESR